jgi:hypothetical protein
MKIFRNDTSVTSEQLNNLYNYLTEDGNKDMDFKMFEEFILCLINNKKYSEDVTIQIGIKHSQFRLIKDNVAGIIHLPDADALKDFILPKIEKYNGLVFDWSDNLIADVFTQVKRYFQTGQEAPDEFLNIFYIEEDNEPQDDGKVNSENIGSRFEKLKSSAKLRMNQFVKKFEAFKTENPDIKSKKILFDLIKLNQFQSDSWDEISRIVEQYSSFVSILNQDIQELNFVIEKGKLKEKELLFENSKIKNQNEILEIDFFNEREMLGNTKCELAAVKQENEKFEQQIHEYETNIFEKQSHIENLAQQKSRLTFKLDSLQMNFEDFTKTISKDQQLINEIKEFENMKLSTMESINMNSENEKLYKEIEELKEEIEGLKQYNSISSREIISLKKHVEELEVLNRNLNRYDDKYKDQPDLSYCNLDMDLSLEQIPEVMSFHVSRRSTIQEIAKSRKVSHLVTIPNFESNINKQLDRENERDKFPSISFKETKSMLNIVRDMSVGKSKKEKVETALSFRDYAYLCFDTQKKFHVLAFKKDTIYILHVDPSKKPVLEVPFSHVTGFVVSRDNLNVIELFYQNSRAGNASIVLEIPSASEFIKILEKCSNSEVNFKKKGETSLDSKPNFKNSYMNLFKDVVKSGVVNYWVNSYFTDWKFVYLIYLKNILIQTNAPEVFNYCDYKKYRREMIFYKMDDYNVIIEQSKIGLTKEFTFAIKIKNEETDLIFSAPSRFEKNKWSDSLSS